MKKGLLGLSAFIMALTMAGCGSVKAEISTKDDSSKETTVSADSKKDSKKSDKSDIKTDTSAPDIKEDAGEYTKNGHAAWGNYPDEFAPEKIEETLKKDPMTISEDGTLHFCGKDYKLTAEGTFEGSHIYSVEGSGFDFKKYCDNSNDAFSTPKCADKDYEGPVYFTDAELHMTVNGEDMPYHEFMVYITAKGDTSCNEYISFTDEVDDDASLSFDNYDNDIDFDFNIDDNSVSYDNNDCITFIN